MHATPVASFAVSNTPRTSTPTPARFALSALPNESAPTRPIIRALATGNGSKVASEYRLTGHRQPIHLDHEIHVQTSDHDYRRHLKARHSDHHQPDHVPGEHQPHQRPRASRRAREFAPDQ